MSSPLWNLVVTRFRESLRYPETIFWTFLFPALLAGALGIAFRGEAGTPSAAVVAAGPDAGRVVAALTSDNAVRAESVPGPEAEHRLRTGRATILIVPGNPVVYRYDPTRPESRLARERVDRAIQRASGRADPLRTRDEPVTEPGGRYIDFLVPGLLGMNLMGGGLWGIGWVVVEMRIRKLLKLQLTTPMPRRDFLLSHVLVRLAFIPLEIVPLLLIAWLLFGVTTAGSLAGLTFIAVVGAISFAGLGTLVASRATTTTTISGLINLCTFPMIVLSGVFFSTTRFPDAIQPAIRALPLTALNDALRAVMVDGASVLSQGPALLVLGIWGAASFVVALRIFRWS